MNKLYRIHFGFSKSKRYPQAVELAKLAHQYEVRGESQDIWHIVTFTDEQIDLMASFYKIARNLPRPKLHGIDILSLLLYCQGKYNHIYPYSSDAYKARIDQVRLAAERLKVETGKKLQELASFLEESYWKPWQEDMVKVNEKLRKEGYLDSFDPASGNPIIGKRKPKEYLPQYQEIRELISKGKYKKAVRKYYDILGDRFYNELHNELIYLKRLGNIPLMGRDLLYFRTESARNELVTSNLSEYCSCIDTVLRQYQKAGNKSPLDILIENAPTMDELIERRKQDWHLGVYLWDGEFKRDNTPVTFNSFSAQYDKCPEGRLFDRYPDQIQHCRIIEAPEDLSFFAGLWTEYSPSFYQRKILTKGLHVSGIEAYRHKLWRRDKREPDFTTVTSLNEISLNEIKKSDYGTDGIRYTGRTHAIRAKKFYEIDLLRENLDLTEDLGNPFIELVEEILREAENLLRENHGLPRIGEGWISEMLLYDLIRTIFPGTEHHATPKWLSPQHLDVFVPSKKPAFEYQGKQHFEPLEFFGGEESFQRTIRLDKRKVKKCKANGVLLIHWRYDEPINQEVLTQKLAYHNVSE